MLFRSGEMEDTSETHKVTAIRKDGKYNIVHGHSVASIREETDLDEKYIGFEKLAGKVGPRLAAFIGRKKYGAKGMTDSKAKHKAEDKKMHEESIPFDGSRPAKALANKFIKTKEWYGDEEKMMKNTKAGVGDCTIGEFLEGVVCVIVDEVHMAKADALKTLLTGVMSRVPIRWGLTGTIPKEKFESQALLVSIGPVINKLAASELQDMGVLAQCHVNVVQLVDHVEYNKIGRAHV